MDEGLHYHIYNLTKKLKKTKELCKNLIKVTFSRYVHKDIMESTCNDLEIMRKVLLTGALRIFINGL